MTDEAHTLRLQSGERPESRSTDFPPALIASIVASAALLAFTYKGLFKIMYTSWNATDSYYSHGFLIPPIVLFICWLKRKEFLAAPLRSSPAGYPLILGAGFFLLLSGFLGFNVIGQLTLLPMIAGLCLIFFGWPRTKVLWFPLLFLIMMIPLPGSVTQSITFKLKLLAAQVAVGITNVLGYPLVRQGSYIHWENDSLLVGDVCGGLRSLIALLAIGMLMAYFSKTKPWARVVILLMSGPIAVVANIFRILLLCIVAYYWGSDYAAGDFHDISGVFIYIVAFALFFTMEGILRKFADKRGPDEPDGPEPKEAQA